MGAINTGRITSTPLARVSVEGGDVLHALKSSDNGYQNFGEAYFSQIEYGAVKAWKRHINMTMNLIVPIGSILFVFVGDDGRRQEIIVGTCNYVRLTVPPKIWFGFKGLERPYNLLLNIADIEHDPTEVERRRMDEITFDWGRQ